MADLDPQWIGLVGGLAASGFTLVRYALAQTKSLTEQFVGFLEGALTRQESVNARLLDTLDELRLSLTEHLALLRQIEERIRP